MLGMIKFKIVNIFVEVRDPFRYSLQRSDSVMFAVPSGGCRSYPRIRVLFSVSPMNSVIVCCVQMLFVTASGAAAGDRLRVRHGKWIPSIRHHLDLEGDILQITKKKRKKGKFRWQYQTK